MLVVTIAGKPCLKSMTIRASEYAKDWETLKTGGSRKSFDGHARPLAFRNEAFLPLWLQWLNRHQSVGSDSNSAPHKCVFILRSSLHFAGTCAPGVQVIHPLSGEMLVQTQEIPGSTAEAGEVGLAPRKLGF